MKPWTRILRFLDFVIGTLLFLGAFKIIHSTVRTFGVESVQSELARVPLKTMMLSIGATLLFYLVVTAYDFLALSYLRVKVQPRQVMLTAFLAHVFGSTLGMANLGSAAVRLRIYPKLGVPSATITQLVALIMLSNWMGFLLLAGFVTLVFPVPLNAPLLRAVPLGTLGVIMLSIPLLGLLARSALRRKLRLPKARAFLTQTGIACLDFAISGGILYLLLPESAALSYGSFLTVYLLCHTIGTLSQVPGDFGVMEAVVLSAVPFGSQPGVLASLVIYRILLYLVPLAIALLVVALARHSFRAK